jgi:uncharacterized protein YqjF (DUF2071 family)
MSRTFLEAQWRKLAMANYAVDEKILHPWLPRHTEIDLWNNTCYVSLVGFMFVDTKVMGFKVPFHIDFEEVNLRFYVRHYDGNTWKRGVVFIKEIVPRPALTFVANTLYKENYETMPMRHSWTSSPEQITVEYQWKKKQWNTLRVMGESAPEIVRPGSEEEFITEHYWGYTRVGESKTSVYQVEHPTWRVYSTRDYFIDVDFEAVYGSAFAFLQSEQPRSVFLAEGSNIVVKGGEVL